MVNKISKIKILKPILEIAILGLSIFFIGRYIWGNWSELSTHIEYANTGYIILAILFFLLYFFFRSLGWWYILKKIGGDIKLAQGGYIWFLSEFSRYIPGNVWSFLGRVYLCDKQKVAKRVASLSLLLEIFYLLGASIAMGVVFFMTGSFALKLPIWTLVILIPIAVTIINPKILGKIINAVFYKWKGEKINFNLSFWHSILIFLIYIIAWSAYGFGSYLTAIAFVKLTGISIIWLICSFVLAWAIGYLSFITPMGLGVREATILTILKSVIASSLASLVAIATRLVMILSELIALAIILSSKKLNDFGLFTKIKEYKKQNPQKFYLYLMVSLYIIYFVVFTFLRHDFYLTSRYDLGNMDQTVWNTAHGHFFQLTSPETGNQVSRFSIHGDVFLIFLAPLYWLIPSPYILLFLQTIVIALGALPIFWLAKDILKNNKLALVMAFLYLMYPGTQWANIFDFHAIALATSFLVFAFYYAYKKRYIPFIIFSLLALSTKETIAFSIIMLSVYVIFKHKNWKVGGSLAVISLIWFGILLGKIIPGAREDMTSHFGLVYYQHFGNTPGQIIDNIITKPSDTLDYISQNNRWRYLALILAPTGFLAIFSPFIILALPPIALNILSDQSQMRTIFYQYTSDIAPFLIISSIFGLNFLMRTIQSRVKIKNKIIPYEKIQKWAFGYILFIILLCSFLFSPLPYARNRDIQPFTKINSAKKYLDELSKTIPRQASVSASNRLSPHFTHHEVSYLFPIGIGQADYIVVEDGYQFELISSQNVSDNIKKLRNDNRYIRIYNKGNIEVFRKK